MNKNNYLRYFKRQNTKTEHHEINVQVHKDLNKSVHERKNHQNQQKQINFFKKIDNNNNQMQKNTNYVQKSNLSSLQREKINLNRKQGKFNNQQQKKLNHQKQNYNCYQNLKILPHITEQFQYKITNALLRQKISSPRRDKLIMKSFQSVNRSNDSPSKTAQTRKTFKIPTNSKQIQRNDICKTTTNSFYKNTDKRQINKQTSQSLQNKTTKSFNKTIYNRKKTANNKKFITRNLLTTFSDLNSSCRNYNDTYTINLQNERMGLRILKTKSRVGEYLNNSYFTYLLYNGKIANKNKFQRKQNQSQIKKNNDLKKFKSIYNVFMKRSSLLKIDGLLDNKSNRSNSKKNKENYQNEQITKKSRFIQRQQCEQSVKDSRMIEKQEEGKTTRQQEDCRSHGANKLKTENLNKSKISEISESFNENNSNILKIKQINKVNTEECNIDVNNFENLNQNQFYGSGDTVIEINNLTLSSQIDFRQNEQLVFELIQNPNKLLRKRRKFNKETTQNNENQKIVTKSNEYEKIKQNGLRFLVHIKKQNKISIKVKKYVDNNKNDYKILGIFDVNLKLWRQRHKINQQTNKSSQEIFNTIQNEQLNSIELYIEERLNQNIQQESPDHKCEWRQILSFESNQPFRMTDQSGRINLNKKKQKKTEQEQIYVKFDCVIYNNNYNRYNNKFVI